MRLVFLGPPGAGKGTQASRVAEKYGVMHASTGDIFRKAVSEGTELGRQVKDIMDRGDLVPDELTCGVVREGVIEQTEDYILDGFPRTVRQAEMLDQMLEERGQSLDKVVYFALDDEEAFTRLTARRTCKSCGKNYNMITMPPKEDMKCDTCAQDLYVRSDGTPEAVRNRLQEYHEKTQPLVPYYEGKGLLVRIDASQGPDEVFEQTIQVLDQLK